MTKKKNSSSKVGPVLVLAAILAGGYYWFSNETKTPTTEGNSHNPNFTYVSDIPTNSDEDASQEEPVLVDGDEVLENGESPESFDTSVESSSSETVVHTQVAKEVKVPARTRNKSNHPAAKKSQSTNGSKNAYVDEYGNVIYTTPNGKDVVKYKIFTQGRWGYGVKYPTFLNKERHGQNSDGVIFEDGKGRKLVTYASWNVFNETISELYHKDFSEAKSVTYKKLFRQQGYYIKSGYTKDNQIFYLKEAIYEKDEQEVVATLLFYYPKSYHKDAEKVVNEIFSSFPRR